MTSHYNMVLVDIMGNELQVLVRDTRDNSYVVMVHDVLSLMVDDDCKQFEEFNGPDAAADAMSCWRRIRGSAGV